MYQKLQESINECNVIVVIGTSGNVINVAWYEEWFEHSPLNNLDPDEKFDPYFKVVYHEKATKAAEKIEAYVEIILSRK